MRRRSFCSRQLWYAHKVGKVAADQMGLGTRLGSGVTWWCLGLDMWVDQYLKDGYGNFGSSFADFYTSYPSLCQRTISSSPERMSTGYRAWKANIGPPETV